MPSLQLPLLKLNARQRLQQFKLTLPSAVLSSTQDPGSILSGAGYVPKPVTPPSSGSGWNRAAPQGARPMGGPIMGTHRAQTAVPTTVPPGLFQAASNDKRDVDFQTAVNAEYDRFLDQMCDAIVKGFDQWRQTAMLTNVVINGAMATGGKVEGGPLEAFIKASAPMQGLFGKGAPICDALSAAIGHGWQTTMSMLTMPPVSWYPSFDAFPGPLAPPTPNVPTPLSSLGIQLAMMNATLLGTDATRRLSPPKPFAAEELITSVVTALEGELKMWVTLQQVMNVMGTGPVPTFAPPHIMVGRVMGGHVIPTPGAFAS